MVDLKNSTFVQSKELGKHREVEHFTGISDKYTVITTMKSMFETES